MYNFMYKDNLILGHKMTKNSENLENDLALQKIVDELRQSNEKEIQEKIALMEIVDNMKNSYSKELEQKTLELEKTNEEKKVLIRTLCHDLSNTIQIITSTTQFMLMQTELVNKKEWERVSRAIKKQDDLIELVSFHPELKPLI